jgi:hypothetical protein
VTIANRQKNLCFKAHRDPWRELQGAKNQTQTAPSILNTITTQAGVIRDAHFAPTTYWNQYLDLLDNSAHKINASLTKIH